MAARNKLRCAEVLRLRSSPNSTTVTVGPIHRYCRWRAGVLSQRVVRSTPCFARSSNRWCNCRYADVCGGQLDPELRAMSRRLLHKQIGERNYYEFLPSRRAARLAHQMLLTPACWPTSPWESRAKRTDLHSLKLALSAAIARFGSNQFRTDRVALAPQSRSSKERRKPAVSSA
jgi:hypothetical protein